MSRNKIISAVSLFASLFCFTSLHAAPVDINSADAQTLAASLNGIGASKAQAIVDYRSSNGKFNSISDLSLVKGIGERTVMRNRDDLALNQDQLNALIKQQGSKNLNVENASKK